MPTTISISAKDGKALLDELEGNIGGRLVSDSLLAVLGAEEEYPGAFELARQLVDAPTKGSIDLHISDVAAAMRAMVDVIEYHNGGSSDAYGEIIDGPICQEDAPGHEGRVEESLESLRTDAAVRQAMVEIVGKLSLARAAEMEFKPLSEIDSKRDRQDARDEFLGKVA